MKVQTGYCRFCGQAIAIESSKELTDEQLVEEASFRCTCPEAQSKRKQEESKRIGKDAVEALFGDMREIAEYLRDGVELLTSGYIGSITVDTGSGTQAKLKVTAKGTVRVTRIEKEKREIE